MKWPYKLRYFSNYELKVEATKLSLTVQHLSNTLFNVTVNGVKFSTNNKSITCSTTLYFISFFNTNSTK